MVTGHQQPDPRAGAPRPGIEPVHSRSQGEADIEAQGATDERSVVGTSAGILRAVKERQHRAKGPVEAPSARHGINDLRDVPPAHAGAPDRRSGNGGPLAPKRVVMSGDHAERDAVGGLRLFELEVLEFEVSALMCPPPRPNGGRALQVLGRYRNDGHDRHADFVRAGSPVAVCRTT
jgi:hypothetical protein